MQGKFFGATFRRPNMRREGREFSDGYNAKA